MMKHSFLTTPRGTRHGLPRVVNIGAVSSANSFTLFPIQAFRRLFAVAKRPSKNPGPFFFSDPYDCEHCVSVKRALPLINQRVRNPIIRLNNNSYRNFNNLFFAVGYRDEVPERNLNAFPSN